MIMIRGRNSHLCSYLGLSILTSLSYQQVQAASVSHYGRMSAAYVVEQDKKIDRTKAEVAEACLKVSCGPSEDEDVHAISDGWFVSNFGMDIQVNDSLEGKLELGFPMSGSGLGGAVEAHQYYFNLDLKPGILRFGRQTRPFVSVAWDADIHEFVAGKAYGHLNPAEFYANGISYETGDLGFLGTSIQFGLFSQKDPGTKESGKVDKPQMEAKLSYNISGFAGKFAYLAEKQVLRNCTEATETTETTCTEPKEVSASMVAASGWYEYEAFTLGLAYTQGDPLVSNSAYPSLGEDLEGKINGLSFYLQSKFDNISLTASYGMESAGESSDDMLAKGQRLGFKLDYERDEVHWIIEVANTSLTFDSQDVNKHTSFAIGLQTSFSSKENKIAKEEA